MSEGGIVEATQFHGLAAEVLARLAPVVLPTLRLTPDELRHVPGALDPVWVERLPLPSAPARGQTVALADRGDFTRVTSAEDLARERAARPRTQVYESVHVSGDSWIGVVALHLAGMLRREVVCSIYQSSTEDSTLGPHYDTWVGVVVQMRGAKEWLIWQGDGEAEEVVMRVGDVMVVPRGMRHDVRTPADPGDSAHLVFAVMDEALPTRPG
ncbi:JmjC domain-containing protein [Streptomyces murinus]|uniref:JmjC domain-containing protein n=1 Tax=Streptomyces murinus TaxID=33900 RepID=UPI00382A9FAF